jgi:hypothetical protein
MSTNGTMYMPRVELLKSFGRGFLPQIWKYKENKSNDRCSETSHIFFLASGKLLVSEELQRD